MKDHDRSETPSTDARRAPWHLWVIGIVALLWSGFGAFDYLMTQTKNPGYMRNFTPEQLTFFYSFPAWVVALWAIGVWGGVLGALLLLFRHRFAVPVLLASVIATVIATFHNLVLSNGLAVAGDPVSIVITIVIVAFCVAFFGYSRTMRSRGVLR